jgi:ATP synthase F1 delta subunit
MPVACLLGYGYPELTEIAHGARLDPKCVCLYGVRSFERGEAELLERLGVRVFLMEEIARVYADSLFQVARDRDKLDEIREQLGQVADELERNRDMQIFFFSPYFSSAEKREGIARSVSGAEPELVNFLELLAEKHRMPVVFRIRRRFDELWAEANKRLDVKLTSAIELDRGVIDHVRKAIERQTDRKIDLEAEVDEDILGGLVLRVGNMVLDASLRNKLERLRKEVAEAA